MTTAVRSEFANLAVREPIPLARAALIVAKEEYPGLDVDKYLDQLADLAREADIVVRHGADTVERVQLLSHFLFGEKGFDGNRDQYADPRNSFLNEVIDRRLGIPITLSVVYLEVGRRLSLNLYGVSFPAHFLVKAVDERGELVIDPFNGGAILDLDDIRARLTQLYGQPVELQPSMLRAVGGRQILVRMLRNLKNIYMNAGEAARMLAALDRILLLDAKAADELLERATLYERLECFTPALADFQNFLTLVPDHPGIDTARESIMRLMPRVARLN
ncbi:MAG: SirB1 family protein [Candidatus Binataceae bacterium]